MYMCIRRKRLHLQRDHPSNAKTKVKSQSYIVYKTKHKQTNAYSSSKRRASSLAISALALAKNNYTILGERETNEGNADKTRQTNKCNVHGN